MQIYSIGHSTLAGDEFARILRETGIRTAIDVRRFPYSKRHPQFGREVLESTLGEAGIIYAHRPSLGGRRAPRPDSPNIVWRHEAFRGYADYMDTAEFRDALAEALALESPIVFFCAESLWWKCHRRMISDALEARGMRVLHISSNGAFSPHRLTDGAYVVDGEIRYDAGQRKLL